ncbi:MAG: ribosome-associated translation inhibitor RaiA [Rhizobiaceae bacterium]|jgi:ribosomal subunit interface protein|nr:ribosome-associated translation inhibitor RaiA [Rhizobiaceae bacterium]
MSLRISGKHMDIGDAFRTQITERMAEATAKYFAHGYTGSVTVEKSAGRFSADCKLHLASGVDLQAKGEAHDPIVAFEKAAEHIEKRLRRYKRKLKNHHAEGLAATPLAGDDYAYRVFEPVDESVEEVAEDYAPAIIAESHKPASVMSVADAVMQLDLTDDPVFVFRAKGSGQINIVYRRADGNIGWVDTSAAAQG